MDSSSEWEMPPEASFGRLKKVLVVDDIVYVVESIRRILREEGYFVITAKSGAEALGKFKSYLPQLVTVDQNLPDMSGMDLVARIRELDSGEKVKIVFITAVSDRDQITEILKQRVDYFLLKPFKRARLVQTVREVLEEKTESPPGPDAEL